MDRKILLDRIKLLENEIKNKQNLINEFQKVCKIPENKKQEILKIIEKQNKINEFFFENGILKFDAFLKILNFLENGYLLLIDYKNKTDLKTKYILSFFTKKFSSYFSKDNDYIYGIVYENELKEIKKLNKISYFNPINDEFDEIEIYNIIFESNSYNSETLYKAKKIFFEYRLRPSFKNKHYIEYSLSKNKLIDFEQEKLNKEKEKFHFIYDETYPNLEIKLKKEINNIPFVLALLERIDKEIDQIKNSRGTVNVIVRILNYIDLHTKENGIKEVVQYLRKKLKE
ncbi:conserved hypothetical protein [Lebetimonas natsushimae]|uniref:Uncharacterized protein n=1 Tax=Lebetimonas natsushimae TaxID=1936991 RepID=A0A292YH22_9BACT|nr:hypothetical protein [Lebetimonas natsushimae]GAX88239.1 conserved hypothetical protein [Lebetimonas natsushimae]